MRKLRLLILILTSVFVYAACTNSKNQTQTSVKDASAGRREQQPPTPEAPPTSSPQAPNCTPAATGLPSGLANVGPSLAFKTKTCKTVAVIWSKPAKHLRIGRFLADGQLDSGYGDHGYFQFGNDPDEHGNVWADVAQFTMLTTDSNVIVLGFSTNSRATQAEPTLQGVYLFHITFDQDGNPTLSALNTVLTEDLNLIANCYVGLNAISVHDLSVDSHSGSYKANADFTCGSGTQLSFPIYFGSASGEADHLDKNNILRNLSNRTVQFTPELAAKDPCRAFNKHIATRREIAKYAQNCGALGILENTPANKTYTDDYNQKSRKRDSPTEDLYYTEQSKDASGAEDDFFFNPTGYRRSECDLIDANGDYWEVYDQGIVFNKDAFELWDFGSVVPLTVNYDYHPGTHAGVWCVAP
jgi:hypothetical protein